MEENFNSGKKNIPAAAGAMIILSVAVLAGCGIFYFYQVNTPVDYQNNLVVTRRPSEAVASKTMEIPKTETVSEEPVKETPEKPTAKETFDFNAELKKLDDQNNSVNSDDWNENEMSDANIGL